MKIKNLDHLVLTVKNIQTSIDFYTNILGMQAVQFANNRYALTFGNQKINLHQQHDEFEPKAKHPKSGSADLCFIIEGDLNDVITHLHKHTIAIELGPIERTGALTRIMSIYIRDPDENLLELSSPCQTELELA